MELSFYKTTHTRPLSEISLLHTKSIVRKWQLCGKMITECLTDLAIIVKKHAAVDGGRVRAGALTDRSARVRISDQFFVDITHRI